MQIELAQLADREQVMSLLSQVWADDYVAECWDEWVSRPEAGVPLVAKIDQDVVGVAYVHLISSREAWMQALRVHPNARRQGVGSALAQAAIDHARARGRQVARLLVDSENDASKSMTARSGFRLLVTFHKLRKTQLRSDGPLVKQPEQDALPVLLQLASDQGARIWHGAWESRDLSLPALEQAWQNQSLRVLAQAPQAALADVNAYDEEYDVAQPLGERQAVLALVHGLETEALTMGKQHVDLFLTEDSPHLESLLQTGYQLMPNDGYTIWEYRL